MGHVVDMFVARGREAVLADSEIFQLGHSVGSVLVTALKEVVRGDQGGFCSIVDVKHLSVMDLRRVFALGDLALRFEGGKVVLAEREVAF